METWKEAFWLAKFELKKSLVNLFFGWLALSLFGTLFLMNFNSYFEPDNKYFGYDFIFLYLFGFGPSMVRAKLFQYQQVNGQLWTSPTLVMQLQLPIPKKSLVKSRLITYCAYLFPFIVTVFTILYLFDSELSAAISAQSYLAFVFIWLAYSFVFGMIMPASDVGDYITTKIMICYSLAMLIAVGILFYFFYQFLGYGIVSWTVMLAQNWPVQSIFIAIILIILSWKFWPAYMKKTMQKLDYM